MKDFMQELKLNFILTALFCIVCGVVLFVWPDVSARIVCMVLGAILVLMGAVYLVSFFSSPAGSFMKQIHLLLTICFVAIGVWILLKPEFVIRLIPVIVGDYHYSPRHLRFAAGGLPVQGEVQLLVAGPAVCSADRGFRGRPDLESF